MTPDNTTYQQYRNHTHRASLYLQGDFHGAKVVDFGANGGRFMEQALAWGAREVIGVEVDPSFHAVPNMLIGSVDDAGLWDEPRLKQTDVSLVLALLQWIADPVAFMQRVGRITTKVIYLESHQPQYDKLKPEDYERAFAATGFTNIERLGTVDQGRTLWRLTK